VQAFMVEQTVLVTCAKAAGPLFVSSLGLVPLPCCCCAPCSVPVLSVAEHSTPFQCNIQLWQVFGGVCCMLPLMLGDDSGEPLLCGRACHAGPQ